MGVPGGRARPPRAPGEEASCDPCTPSPCLSWKSSFLDPRNVLRWLSTSCAVLGIWFWETPPPPAPHPAPSSSPSRAQALGTCPCYLPFPKTPPCCFGKQRDGQEGDRVPACRLTVPLSPPGALFLGFLQCWQGTSCEPHPLITVPSSHFHSGLGLSRFSPTWKVSRWATRVRKA